GFRIELAAPRIGGPPRSSRGRPGLRRAGAGAPRVGRLRRRGVLPVRHGAVGQPGRPARRGAGAGRGRAGVGRGARAAAQPEPRRADGSRVAGGRRRDGLRPSPPRPEPAGDEDRAPPGGGARVRHLPRPPL
ncbi:MAG: hypothetical protein AVDCRST_MAG04-2402, partial [uncultured Acetobacteraceae bacterium]